MHFCQMCVRKPHCRDGCQPHYPVRNEAHLEERLKEEGAEKARERKLLAGPSLKWAMHDAEFRRQRDVYRERARRGADDELSQYYAWGQTKYTVHLAVWLPSDRAAADVTFEEVEPEDAAADGEDAVWVGGGAGQRMTVTPADLPPILRGVFAHGIDTSRAGEALTFESLHSMTSSCRRRAPASAGGASSSATPTARGSFPSARRRTWWRRSRWAASRRRTTPGWHSGRRRRPSGRRSR